MSGSARLRCRASWLGLDAGQAQLVQRPSCLLGLVRVAAIGADGIERIGGLLRAQVAEGGDGLDRYRQRPLAAQRSTEW